MRRIIDVSHDYINTNRLTNVRKVLVPNSCLTSAELEFQKYAATQIINLKHKMQFVAIIKKKKTLRKTPHAINFELEQIKRETESNVTESRK